LLGVAVGSNDTFAISLTWIALLRFIRKFDFTLMPKPHTTIEWGRRTAKRNLRRRTSSNFLALDRPTN